MGLRLYRRLHVLPGLRLNVGTRGASLSFGHRGAWYTLSTHGRRTATLGWPGTGLLVLRIASGGYLLSNGSPRWQLLDLAVQVYSRSLQRFRAGSYSSGYGHQLPEFLRRYSRHYRS